MTGRRRGSPEQPAAGGVGLNSCVGRGGKERQRGDGGKGRPAGSHAEKRGHGRGSGPGVNGPALWGQGTENSGLAPFQTGLTSGGSRLTLVPLKSGRLPSVTRPHAVSPPTPLSSETYVGSGIPRPGARRPTAWPETVHVSRKPRSAAAGTFSALPGDVPGRAARPEAGTLRAPAPRRGALQPVSLPQNSLSLHVPLGRLPSYHRWA